MRQVRRERILYGAAAVLAFPPFLVSLLLALSLVNPMGLAFLTTFTIENQTSKQLWVTPIGAVGKDGQRKTLPMSAFTFPNLPSPNDRDFTLTPGGNRSFTYDWDDVQFSEILVRDATGAFRALPTGLHPIEGQYRRPEQDRFVIKKWEDLAAATPAQMEALQTRRGRRVVTLYILALAGLAFPYFVVKAARASGQPPPLPTSQP